MNEKVIEKSGCRGERESNKRRRAKLKSLGLCVRCKNPNDTKVDRCSICTAKAVAENKRIKEEARASGKCFSCQKEWIGETKRCSECKEKQRNKWALKINTNQCFRCTSPRAPNSKSCLQCKLQMRKASITRRNKLSSEGKCVQCTLELDNQPSLKYCITCTLKTAAYRWLDDPSRWEELLIMYNNQNKKCAYTKVPITIGLNASIDHKIPRSRNGSNTIDNLHWVDWNINQCKRDQTHEEFIDMCKLIASNYQ